MRVLVTGGAGFIGSHFVHRLAAAGDEVVVLDKLTYAGNRANLDGVEHEFHEGDICDPDAVAAAAEGCEAIVNFAAESHVDRSILGPAEFILTDVLGTQVLLDHARHAGHPARPGLHRRGLRRHPARRAAVHRGRSAPAVEPLLGVEDRRRPPGARLRAHLRGRRLHHPRRQQLRPAPVPGEADPALHHERVRGEAAPGLRRRAAAPRMAPCRRLLLGDRARDARGPARRDLQRRAGRSRRTWRWSGRSST